MINLESQYLSLWPDDTEYKHYLNAWLEYRRDCSSFDSKIVKKRKTGLTSKQQIEMANNAKEVAKRTIDKIEVKKKDKWIIAKLESSRIVDKENGIW